MTEPKQEAPSFKDEITPKQLYLTRRDFLKAAGIVSASAVLAACIGTAPPTNSTAPALDTLTSEELAKNFINYYEFSLSKTSVTDIAKDFSMSPWEITVEGLVRKPKTFTIEDILDKFPQEQRIYRMRCVEGWSMVLPWNGFPLARLLDEVEPLPEAKYVGFQTVLRPEAMPGQVSLNYPWPYLEGLRLDEAMHDLTILATGMYDEPLTPQNGGPIRLVVPWKYGFKSIKSVVRIRLTEDQPVTFWNALAANEYGFYANVNPEVDHPRWSQAQEQRMGDGGLRPTLLHNGYEKEVASLYEGMDLTKFF